MDEYRPHHAGLKELGIRNLAVIFCDCTEVYNNAQTSNSLARSLATPLPAARIVLRLTHSRLLFPSTEYSVLSKYSTDSLVV
jgi:hypothetical protein